MLHDDRWWIITMNYLYVGNVIIMGDAVALGTEDEEVRIQFLADTFIGHVVEYPGTSFGGRATFTHPATSHEQSATDSLHVSGTYIRRIPSFS